MNDVGVEPPTIEVRSYSGSGAVEARRYSPGHPEYAHWYRAAVRAEQQTEAKETQRFVEYVQGLFRAMVVYLWRWHVGEQTYLASFYPEGFFGTKVDRRPFAPHKRWR